MIIKLLLSIILLFVGTVVFSGTIDPNTPDSKHLEYGAKFVYLAKIIGKTPDGKPYQASGVAHKSNIVITAAHIINDVESCYVNINNTTYKVQKTIPHPKYKHNQFGYYDIALCVIDGDMGLSWYPELYAEKNEIGKICSIAGYGGTGDFVNGVKTYDQKLRAGSNIIDGIDRGLLICSPSRTNRTELEFCIAAGDSGGGLFIDNRLAGINSCVMNNFNQIRSTYGTDSGHTRISDHIDWINEQIKLINK